MLDDTPESATGDETMMSQPTSGSEDMIDETSSTDSPNLTARDDTNDSTGETPTLVDVDGADDTPTLADVDDTPTLDPDPLSAGEDMSGAAPVGAERDIISNTSDETPTEKQTGFAALGLPPRLLKTLDNLGFVEPTPIQVSTIPPLLTGRDIVGVAQTGTGKTAAFGLPMLAGIDPHRHAPQGLVLAPTRELALQVARALQDLAAGSPHIHITAVYGGAPWLAQKRALQAGTHIVVGTPGRIIDHMDRGTLDLSAVHFVVLDEGDEMLRMGFAEEVDRILTGVPEQRQIALFSATMPPEIQRTVEAHLHNPRKIAVTAQSSTVDSIDQRYAIVPQRHKVAALARVLATTNADATLVFVQTKAAAEEVGASLVQRGVAASVISGDVPQNDREKVVERLRSGQLDVVVATDVAARGLDVDRIGLVVNLDMPRETESYVHRIGRTGRAGRTGVALSFITPKERDRLRRVEKATKAEVTAMTIPTLAEVSRHRVASLLAQVPTDGHADKAVRRAVKEFLGATSGVSKDRSSVARAAGLTQSVTDTSARESPSTLAAGLNYPDADASSSTQAAEEGSKPDAQVADADVEVPWYVIGADAELEADDSEHGRFSSSAAGSEGSVSGSLDALNSVAVGVPDDTAGTPVDPGDSGDSAEESVQGPIDWEALERTWNTGPLWSGTEGAGSLDRAAISEVANTDSQGHEAATSRTPSTRSLGNTVAAQPRVDVSGENTSVSPATVDTASDLAERAIDLAAALVELAVNGRGSMSLDDDGMDEELGRVARRGRDHERPPKGAGSRDRGSRERGYDRKRRDRDGRDGDPRDRERRGPARDGDYGASDRRPHRGGKQPEFRRYWIGVGRRHGVNPGAIVGALTNEGGLHGRDLGKIDMFAGFSIVEIAPTLNGQALRRLSRASVAGQPLRIRPDLSTKPR